MSRGADGSPFLQVYGEVTARNQGSFVPEEAVEGLSGITGADPEEVRALLFHPPAEGAVYPDVAGFLSELARTDGQYVSIWTQGEMATADGGPGYQLKKIGQAGISAFLNPGWRVRNAAMGLPRVLGHLNHKSGALPDIIPALAEGGFESVVVIDDLPANHARARQVLESEGWGETDHYVMSRPGRDCSHNGRRGPRLSAAELDFPVSTVSSFDEIALEGYTGSRTLWLVDLDYTLIDHRKVVEGYSQRIDPLGEDARAALSGGMAGGDALSEVAA